MVSIHIHTGNLHSSFPSPRAETLSPLVCYNPFSRQSCTSGTGRERCDRRGGVCSHQRNGRGEQTWMEVGLTLAERCGYGEEGAGREWRFPCHLGASVRKKAREKRGEDEQKMPLMSVVKSHPCCLPQFHFLCVEDEHVHLTHNVLESGTKEQRSRLLAWGHSWVEKSTGA